MLNILVYLFYLQITKMTNKHHGYCKWNCTAFKRFGTWFRFQWKVRLVLISSDGKDTHSPVLTMWPHSFLLLAVIQFILGACYAGLGTIESLAERDVCLRCYYVFSIRIYISKWTERNKLFGIRPCLCIIVFRQRNTLAHQLLDGLKKLFQIPLMSLTLSTNFFPREEASEFLSAGLTVLRTPLSHCPLKHWMII